LIRKSRRGVGAVLGSTTKRKKKEKKGGEEESRWEKKRNGHGGLLPVGDWFLKKREKRTEEKERDVLGLDLVRKKH